jgi:iron complex outermembrane receptor protein
MFNLIKYSLVSVLTLGLFSTPTFAQDSDEDADVEEVIVTGSRIGRSEYSGINPVTLITSEDIEASGQLNISEVLRSTVQNTLGSTYEGFQNGGTDANISLRGAGSGRTLILLDGKRMPGSPKQSGAAANINVIPTAAIDRVEILTDGASAIYGGDAAAGVVNVILKDNFEGVSFRGGTTEPDMPGGKEDSFSVTVGGSSEKSTFVMTLEHQERDTIYWKDRWYTKSNGTESDDYADWNGVSQGSRTYVNGDTFQYLPMAACVNNPLMVDNGRLFYDSNYPGDSGCGFDYTAVGADDASRKSDALFANFTYEIDETTTFGLRGTFSRVDGTSRFAPAVGSYRMKAGQFDIIAPTYTFSDGGTWGPDADGNYNDTLPSGTVTGLTNTDNIVPAPADGFGLIRFTENGNREMDTVSDLYDIVMSLDGMLGTWNYNFSAQFSNQLSNEHGYNYINKYAYAQLAATPGFDPSLKANVDIYRQDTFERAENRYDNYFLGFGNDISDEVSVYLGVEYFEFGYESRYDAGRNGLNVIGSAGNSSAGYRDNTAFFVEGLYTPEDVEGLEVSVSARQDDYSDFGSASTSKIGAAYDITDELFVRASIGDSFIPADMTSLYGAPAESFQFATDFTSCRATGIADADCPERQYASFLVSNANLQPETSDSINMGVVWSPSFMAGNQSFSLDYYEITFEDLQTRITLQGLINAELSGSLAAIEASSGALLNRASNGKLSSAIEQASLSPLINSSDSEFRLEGMDFKYSSTWDIGPGALDVDLDATYYTAYESSTGSSKVDSVGAKGVPEWRANLYLSYGWDDHTVRAAYYYIPETASTRDANDKLVGSIDGVGFLDVSYKYDTPWNSVVTVGMRNATDEEPPLDNRLNYDRGLYFMGHLGPVTYVTLSHNF